MKRIILMMTVLLSFAVSTQAAANMAEIIVTGENSDVDNLVQLFNTEAQIPNSPLSVYMTALRADPENKGFYIYDTIDTSDIVRLDSGAGGGTFEINYLILIRAGYKSNTFQVGYLKAQMLGSIEEDQSTIVRITEPGKVTIE